MNRPWLRHYDPGVPAEVKVPEESVPWLLWRAAERFPDLPALNFYGRRTTYAALRDQAARLASGLRELGLAPGERLAILLPNCPQLVAAYFAALSLGAVLVLINPLNSPTEVRYQVEDSGARILLALDHLLPKAAGLLEDGKLTRLIVTSLTEVLPWPLSWLYPLKAWRQGLPRGCPPEPGYARYARLLTSPPRPEPPRPTPEEVAVLQYTGGTTGVPKAAVLTHANLMANVAQINAWMPRVKVGEERLVGLLPLFHAFGLTVCLNWPVSVAAQILLLPRFEIREFLRLLRRDRPTILPGVPTLFVGLIHHPHIREVDFSCLWACVSGSAPLPAEVRESFERLTGCPILEGYGLTEASPVTHFTPFGGPRPGGSIGVPFPGTEARIVDDVTGERDLPPGEVGELIIRGPQVMQGYWGRPEETALVLRNGWLYTGDLARMDEAGYFYIMDRKKDIIISAGYKIFPREVEEVLFQHPGIKEAVVVGVPDPYRGEMVQAVIVPQPGARLTPEEVQAFCRERLAAYKVPRRVEFRAELPKSAVGKVLRRRLREEGRPSLAAGSEPA
ncbi:MAG: long-chain fatty acid--CoA ligase [Syntrophobacterales bacterium]|nr:long-chain fatty acid--CoA ligase [Syntrophobacterales bacterium]